MERDPQTTPLEYALASYRCDRQDRGAVAATLEELGGPPDCSLRSFYERYSGPFGSAFIGYSLLDLLDQDMNVVTQTKELRDSFAFPDRYIVISDYLANAVLVYDFETDAVYNMDFEGADRALLDGKLEPDWETFDVFLRDYFLGNGN